MEALAGLAGQDKKRANIEGEGGKHRHETTGRNEGGGKVRENDKKDPAARKGKRMQCILVLVPNAKVRRKLICAAHAPNR